MLVPVFLLVLLGMLEFAFASQSQHESRICDPRGAPGPGCAAMADGSITDSACGGAQLTDADVDPLIITAVQRVPESPGSMVDISQVQNITIYQASATGTPVAGKSNVLGRVR